MSKLVISEIYHALQGEGPSAGQPCAFVRLGACNLYCRWCDSPYTWVFTAKARGRHADGELYKASDELTPMTAGEVLDEIDKMRVRRVVITGGEPLLQQDKPAWRELVRNLRLAAMDVEVETNGTIAPNEASMFCVERFNVSPKLSSSGVEPEDREKVDVLTAFSALSRGGRALFKFVVAADDIDDDLAEVLDLIGFYGIPNTAVWLMPEARDATALAARLAEIVPRAVLLGLNVSNRLQVQTWGDRRGV